MAFMDFLDVIPTILQGVSGYNQMNQGFSLQKAAAKMSSKAYLQAADMTKQQAEYNVEIDRQDLEKRLHSYASDIIGISSKQRNQMATTGASLTSKSFLALTNRTLDVMTHQIKEAKDINTLQAQQRRYNAEVAAVDLKNRSLMADYEYQVAKYNQKQAKGDAMSKGINTLIGGLGSLLQ